MKLIRVETNKDVFRAIKSITGDVWFEWNYDGSTLDWKFPGKNAFIRFDCWGNRIELHLIVEDVMITRRMILILEKSFDDNTIHDLLSVFYELKAQCP